MYSLLLLMLLVIGKMINTNKAWYIAIVSQYLGVMFILQNS